MTREQAIEILNKRECCRECVINNGDCNDCEKAFDMAIKALEQQPNDDCVSRKTVIDAVENTIAKYIPTFIGQYEKIPLELAKAIMDVTPVTPTRKQGKWIYHFERDDYNDYENEYYECPFCHDLGGDKYYHYCPVCGNKVKGVEDGSN